MRQVDATQLAKPESRRPLVNAVHAEEVAERVEVDVAGLLERLTHGHRPVTAGLVTLEEAPVERRTAPAEDARLRGDDAFLEPGNCDSNLEGGAGRVTALDGPVVRGRIGSVSKPFHAARPIPAANAFGS